MGKVVLLLAITSAGLGLTSLHLVKQLRQSDATIAQLQTRMAALQEQTAAAPAIPKSGPVVAPSRWRAAAAPAPANDALKSDPAHSPIPVASLGTPASHEERIRMIREHRERQRQLMQDPEYREAMRVQARANLVRQYPGLINELGLDQQQAEEFFEMLADQQQRTNEQMEPLWSPEDDENRDPAAIQERHSKLQQAATEMQRKSEAELAARFGQDKLQVWQEYQSTMGQRYQLEHMRNTLAAMGLPLNDDSSRPMLKALAAAQKAEVEEYAASPARAGGQVLAARGWSNVAFDAAGSEQQIEMTKKRNQRTLDAVSPYLTVEQRKALEREQEAQLKMLQAQRRIMRARGDTNTNGFFAEGSAVSLIVPQ